MPHLSPAGWNDPVVQQLTAAQTGLRARYDGNGEPRRSPSADDVAVVPVVRGDDGTTGRCGALPPLAAARGWTNLRLETGPRRPEALGLHSAAGYQPIEAFGYYRDDQAADSLFFARTPA